MGENTSSDRGDFIAAYLAATHRSLEDLQAQLIDVLPRMAERLEAARQAGRTVFVMGNGGSGSTASHMANDLNKYTVTEGQRRFKCVALTDNLPFILAVGNDIGFEDIFVEQLRNLGEPGDVLVGISGSGNSPNCLKAIEYARSRHIDVLTWTGFGGGRMADLADQKLIIPSHNMAQCEDVHLIIQHCLVTVLKAGLERQVAGR